ncbi:extracellular solute-binding protein [Bacillus sp. EB106-08-02-XG196]|uniref:ABC transporter substrate-binding protein n=1 Tax=Bacillus sp. EB106-08-02-XG196 TaxID=2737049 RepID=UPI0015C43907|nr:extracellular solute-binding protein [Bacillus sp. EB106-08-02-XG196]NWQ41889.1 extracellular solute-binding protein [Bacillus sp. EB106-08-02-XG196]
MLRKLLKKGFALSVVLSILFLAACGSNSEKQESADGTVELSFWNSWSEDSPENDVMLARVEAFQKEHPEIKLKMESIPPDQYKTKLKTQAAGKQLPDMIQTWPGAELRPLVEGGVLMPIDDIVDHWKDTTIPADTLKDYAIDGKQYAIPGNKVFTSIIYYDKDLVASAGFNEFPTTYADFKSLITKLNAQDITPIALGNKAKWPLQSVYISTIADRVTGSDFLEKVFAGEKKFTDKEFVDALGVIAELTKLKAFNTDANTIDDNQASDYFLQGKAAMFVNGTWALSGLIGSAPEGKNIGVAKFPAIEGGQGEAAAISGVTGWGIALNSEVSDAEKEAATTFFKFLYEDETYKNLMSIGTLVPANVEVPEETSALFKETVELTNGGISPVYDAVLPAEITDIINNGLQAITIGESTPEKVAKEMQDAVE